MKKQDLQTLLNGYSRAFIHNQDIIMI